MAREQARKDLPLSTYTQAFWKIDVHNLMHFLELRLDAHAQQEIREFANAVLYFFNLAFPYISAAFEDYRLEAITFSRVEVEILGELLRTGRTQDMLDGSTKIDLVGREATEFRAKLARIRHG